MGTGKRIATDRLRGLTELLVEFLYQYFSKDRIQIQQGAIHSTYRISEVSIYAAGHGVESRQED